MNDQRRKEVALFRLAVLGDLIHTEQRHGGLRRALQAKSREVWLCPDGRSRRIAVKTIQSWLYSYRKRGFAGLIPRQRRDKGSCKAIPEALQSLILGMKQEDPGRSIPLILNELRSAGLMRHKQFSTSALARFLKRHGLSGPVAELSTPVRYRFVAARCGELWQGDACHGPKLFDPGSGREVRAKIFGLLDDKSRLVPYLRASFHERQEDFLRVLIEAIQRRGIPGSILLDNHGSFTGGEARVACAQLGIRLVFARPYDGPSKGKIERFWRTLRSHVLDRLDRCKVKTLDDLNVRLMTWVASEYNQRPHAGLSGRTPLSVFEEDAEQVRFVEDTDQIQSAMVATVERVARNDSTCTWRGRTFEVPPHLRGRRVTLHYNLLRPERVWIEDAAVQIPLREVDPVANARRPRPRPRSGSKATPPRTSLNAVEDLLGRTLRPREERGDGEEGTACARS